MWKTSPFVLYKVSLSSTPWVLKCASLAFCLSGVWGLVWGVGFGFFSFWLWNQMVFLLNNRLCKIFSWLLYLEFSYINCFPHTSSSSLPCWRTESQEISAIEKRLNWVWVLYSIAHPLALWNLFSNCCHVWSKWHQCFQSGILSTLCFLSLGQHFFSAFQTVCDMLKNKNGNAWYFPSFPSCLLEKKNLFNRS